MNENEIRETPETPAPNTYSTPTLIEYGTIQEITQGGGGVDFDPLTLNTTYLS